MTSERASQQTFLGVSALLFGASAAVTIVWCASMSAMGGMPMPGGRMMSMAWMRLPGQTWLGAAASFLGMWVVMMMAMLLPSLVPMLWRHRRAVGRTGETHFGWLTALVGVAYLFVWTVFGNGRLYAGRRAAAIEMQQPAVARTVPIAVGVVVLIAGALQFTAWKAHHLACCREVPGHGSYRDTVERHASESAINDLLERLAHTRWPEPGTEPGFLQGVPIEELLSLVDYWRNVTPAPVRSRAQSISAVPHHD